ncbi:hypothetical protein TNCV_3413751 [Trichonephila clavipes]|uniref:Uncharacterized protein n=1 Tax=Trichonephila clavipes TaxID=2585209 RepID=A0A8X6RFF3_TRICX|nr:hypothetical protein TNCV_3413751 [Trichonephila clavipes]
MCLEEEFPGKQPSLAETGLYTRGTVRCVPLTASSKKYRDPCGGGDAAEELRASSVTAPRNALPKAVPEDEELGCGWLGGGDSFISRNPPWLRPWTVPGSTLWGFPRCLALKNPPAVTLGTLEKCGNSWPGWGRDGTRRNPCQPKHGDK